MDKQPDAMEVVDLPPFTDFVGKVTEMYAHNIIHYGEENPTLDGAFHEVWVSSNFKKFKVYTDDADKVLVADNLYSALEVLKNNGYIIEVEEADG